MHLQVYLLANSASFCLKNWFLVDGVTYSSHRLSQKSSQLWLVYPGRDCQMWHWEQSMYQMIISTFWRLESLQLSTNSSYSSRKFSIGCLISPGKYSTSFDHMDGMVAVLCAGVHVVVFVGGRLGGIQECLDSCSCHGGAVGVRT